MKQLLTAFWMAQSMFCALPFPCRSWDEDARGKMMLFLPVIGAEVGLFWMLCRYVLTAAGIPGPLSAFLLCAAPYLVTGLIHLDGYLDVVDAIGSWREPEQRRAILKDAHVGSFAVVGCGFLLLGHFACFASLAPRAFCPELLLIPVVSRCCAALAVMSLPPMATSQYSRTVYPGGYRLVLILILLLCTGIAFALWKKAVLVPLAVMLGFSLALRRSFRLLEGMNGDIAGFSLTVGELCGLLALALL